MGSQSLERGLVVFLGRYEYNLDEKGRLAIPARLRNGDDGTVDWVLAQGLDGCLFLYPVETWREVAGRVQSLAANQRAARRFARLLFAGAVEVTLDKQGRVGIPQHLRAWAELKREVIVVGVGRRIEIWDKAAWEDYAADADYEDAAETLGELEF
ncbi:MAG: division/cell wall cluster transcriptional repressor MraZ [Candidatus Coatesbacteria bacterium]|nr:division/cell wall cluster transcriptional repressor MraZ [Candidatus Coatesbacteria bacterium]